VAAPLKEINNYKAGSEDSKDPAYRAVTGLELLPKAPTENDEEQEEAKGAHDEEEASDEDHSSESSSEDSSTEEADNKGQSSRRPRNESPNSRKVAS
jgi:hypothetical protein